MLQTRVSNYKYFKRHLAVNLFLIRAIYINEFSLRLRNLQLQQILIVNINYYYTEKHHAVAQGVEALC
jgi:hypothetical protein